MSFGFGAGGGALRLGRPPGAWRCRPGAWQLRRACLQAWARPPRCPAIASGRPSALHARQPGRWAPPLLPPASLRRLWGGLQPLWGHRPLPLWPAGARLWPDRRGGVAVWGDDQRLWAGASARCSAASLHSVLADRGVPPDGRCAPLHVTQPGCRPHPLCRASRRLERRPRPPLAPPPRRRLAQPARRPSGRPARPRLARQEARLGPSPRLAGLAPLPPAPLGPLVRRRLGPPARPRLSARPPPLVSCRLGCRRTPAVRGTHALRCMTPRASPHCRRRRRATPLVLQPLVRRRLGARPPLARPRSPPLAPPARLPLAPPAPPPLARPA